MMLSSLRCLCAATIIGALLAPVVWAQALSSYRSTVTNASLNTFQPGNAIAIKYRGAVISSPNMRQDNASQGNFTRHARLENSTGIGGSSFQTTSVTSEARPAFVRPLSVSTGSPLIARPVLNLQFGVASSSPALQTFKPLDSDIGGAELFGRAPESFTTANVGQRPLLDSSVFSSPVDQFKFGE